MSTTPAPERPVVAAAHAYVEAHRHPETVAAPVELRYEGLITRAIAMAIDAAVINVVAIITGIGVGLVMSVLSVGEEINSAVIALGGLAFFIWTVSYFVVFWSTTGETPGNRVMGIRVCRYDGTTIGPKRALIRLGGLVLAVIPLFAGLLPILVDGRRRGLQDMLARTVVVETDEEPAAS